jgi:hypothetical protein
MFDEGLDYRTIVRRVIYGADLGTIADTDPPLLARISGDGLELHFPTGIHAFQRNSIIPQFSDLRDSVKLFLRLGARPGGVLEEHVAIMAQIKDTSQAPPFKCILRANHSEVFIGNTKASAANRSVTNGFVDHFAITR